MEDTQAPYPYLLSIEVQDLRCLRGRQRLNTSRPDGRPARWTVLLGDNGVGKTTLLQAIAFCGPVLPREGYVLFDGDTTEIHAEFLPSMRLDSNTLKRKARGRGRTRVSSIREKSLLKANGEQAHEIAMYHAHSADWYATDENIGVLSWGDDWFTAGPDEDYLVVGYGASRLMTKQGDSRFSTAKDNPSAVASLFSFDNRLQNAEEWLLKADYSAKFESPGQERFKTYFAKVKAALQAILPDVQDITIAPPSTVGSQPSVVFHTHYGPASLSQLSLGYQIVIGWVTDFANRLFERYPDSDNPLAEAALCLIDEIDLHLHPRWQRDVMGYLSNLFPNTQFVVSSHSPLIVLAVADANIAVLKREGDHVVIHNDVEEVHNWRVDQVLTSDLFGLKSARSPAVEKLLAEKRGLLRKSTLSEQDKDRVAAIDRELDANGGLPTGETEFDRRAMELIRKVGARLEGTSPRDGDDGDQ